MNLDDYVGHNGMSNIFCQIVKLWDLDNTFDFVFDNMKNMIYPENVFLTEEKIGV